LKLFDDIEIKGAAPGIIYEEDGFDCQDEEGVDDDNIYETDLVDDDTCEMAHNTRLFNYSTRIHQLQEQFDIVPSRSRYENHDFVARWKSRDKEEEIPVKQIPEKKIRKVEKPKQATIESILKTVEQKKEPAVVKKQAKAESLDQKIQKLKQQKQLHDTWFNENVIEFFQHYRLTTKKTRIDELSLCIGQNYGKVFFYLYCNKQSVGFVNMYDIFNPNKIGTWEWYLNLENSILNNMQKFAEKYFLADETIYLMIHDGRYNISTEIYKKGVRQMEFVRYTHFSDFFQTAT